MGVKFPQRFCFWGHNLPVREGPHTPLPSLWPCSAICGWDANRTKAPHSQNTFPLKNPICQALTFQAHRQQGRGGESPQPRGDLSPLPASTICPGQHGGPHASAPCSVGPRPVTSPFWASVSPCVTCRSGMGWSITCHTQKNIGEKNNGIETKQCYYIPVCAVC